MRNWVFLKKAVHLICLYMHLIMGAFVTALWTVYRWISISRKEKKRKRLRQTLLSFFQECFFFSILIIFIIWESFHPVLPFFWKLFCFPFFPKTGVSFFRLFPVFRAIHYQSSFLISPCSLIYYAFFLHSTLLYCLTLYQQRCHLSFNKPRCV